MVILLQFNQRNFREDFHSWRHTYGAVELYRASLAGGGLLGCKHHLAISANLAQISEYLFLVVALGAVITAQHLSLLDFRSSRSARNDDAPNKNKARLNIAKRGSIAHRNTFEDETILLSSQHNVISTDCEEYQCYFTSSVPLSRVVNCGQERAWVYRLVWLA